MEAIFPGTSSHGEDIPLTLSTIASVHGSDLAARLSEFLESSPDWNSAPETVSQQAWSAFLKHDVPLDARHFTQRCLEHNLTAFSRREELRQLDEERTAGLSTPVAWGSGDRYEEAHLYMEGIPADRVPDIERYKFFLFRSVYSTPFVQTVDVDVKSSMHGEINFPCFHKQVLATLDVAHGSTFVDLGSGCGKACVAAHLVCPFAVVLGVEVRSTLHNVACEVLDKLEALGCLRSDGYINFEHGDLLDFDRFCDFDVIFVSSGDFSDSHMRHIEDGCKHMKPEAYLISTKLVSSDCMEFLRKEQVRMTWDTGGVALHIYRKRTLSGFFSRIYDVLDSRKPGEVTKVQRMVSEAVEAAMTPNEDILFEKGTCATMWPCKEHVSVRFFRLLCDVRKGDTTAMFAAKLSNGTTSDQCEVFELSNPLLQLVPKWTPPG